VLPYQIASPEALAISKDIPLMIGTVKNEFMPSLGAGLSNATLPEIEAYMKKRFGEKADAVKVAVKKAYPNDTKPSDLIDVDVMFRPGAVEQANLKSGFGGAPVFMYLMTWQSPVMDGKFKAVHCMEIAFAFNNIARCEEMTGGGKDAYALAHKVSQSWINFARTGNPGHKDLPQWPAFNETNTATMHFDNQCVVKPQLDKALFDVVGN
jgi:para-nitrobenzyl esterase